MNTDIHIYVHIAFIQTYTIEHKNSPTLLTVFHENIIMGVI